MVKHVGTVFLGMLELKSSKRAKRIFWAILFGIQVFPLLVIFFEWAGYLDWLEDAVSPLFMSSSGELIDTPFARGAFMFAKTVYSYWYMVCALLMISGAVVCCVVAVINTGISLRARFAWLVAFIATSFAAGIVFSAIKLRECFK